MPIVAYMSMKRRRVTDATTKRKELRDVFCRLKVSVKSEAEALLLAERKDFVRFCTALYTLPELIAIRKAEGRSDWYV